MKVKLICTRRESHSYGRGQRNEIIERVRKIVAPEMGAENVTSSPLRFSIFPERYCPRLTSTRIFPGKNPSVNSPLPRPELLVSFHVCIFSPQRPCGFLEGWVTYTYMLCNGICQCEEINSFPLFRN